MLLTLLGTGCPVAHPSRAGAATLVETEGARVLIDCGSMVTQRLVAAGCAGAKLDALLVTHLHTDHLVDFYQLVTSSWHQGRAEPWVVHCPETVTPVIKATMAAWADERALRIAYEKRPSATGLEVNCEHLALGRRITIGDLEIEIFHQDHGNTVSLGFLFNGRFAYSTDVVGLAEEVLDALHGVPLWIVEALRDTPHQSHSHYDQTFAWIDRVKPARAVLTHLGLEADYVELSAICPENTEPGVDGMVFSL